jgi:hypothetical protein
MTVVAFSIRITNELVNKKERRNEHSDEYLMNEWVV